MIAWLLSAALSAPPAPIPEAMQAARMHYYQGQAAEALPQWERLLGRELSEPERLEALKFRAFCLFVLERFDEARAGWRELLARDPRAKVDPNEASPEFVAFFNPIAPPAASAAGAATPPGAASIRAQPDASESPLVPEASTADTPTERGCGVMLCLLPFGVGQFANGAWIKGTLFAVLQAAALATNIGMYWAQSPTVPPTDAYLIGQHVAFGVFASAVLAGILDAFVFY